MSVATDTRPSNKISAVTESRRNLSLRPARRAPCIVVVVPGPFPYIVYSGTPASW